MVQHLFGEFLCLLVRHIRAQPFRVQPDFVHAEQPDCGEVIVEFSEIALRIRIQPFVQEFCDDFALDVEGTRRDVHHMIQALEKVFPVFRQICDARHVDGDDSDGAGAFAAAEESAGFLAEFAQIETQAAAHAADVAGLHVAVDVIREIRRPVF